jgi:hypothetical protein
MLARSNPNPESYGPLVGNLSQGLERSIEPPERGGGRLRRLVVRAKPSGEKPEKGAALIRYRLIGINVSTSHIGLDSNNSPKRLFLCRRGGIPEQSRATW